MPKRTLEGRLRKKWRPAKVPRHVDLGIQAEPVSDEPAKRGNKESVTQAEPVSSDNISYDLLTAAILRQIMSSNQTNSSDDTMKIT